MMNQNPFDKDKEETAPPVDPMDAAAADANAVPSVDEAAMDYPEEIAKKRKMTGAACDTGMAKKPFQYTAYNASGDLVVLERTK
jgi:hypothetical protein